MAHEKYELYTVMYLNKYCHSSRTLQLNAVPECLAYGGFGGELFLGIKGDLYKIDCAKFLPQQYQQMVTSLITQLFC